MITPRRISEQRVEEAVLYHRIGIVVAEVTSASNKKADERMYRARRAADEIRRMAPAARELMAQAPPVSRLSGPQAASELKAFRRLWEEIAQGFRENVFDPFLREHGNLVENDARDAVVTFLGWLPQRCQELRDRVRQFENNVTTDLKDDAERMAQLAHDWSAVDADGLE